CCWGLSSGCGSWRRQSGTNEGARPGGRDAPRQRDDRRERLVVAGDVGGGRSPDEPGGAAGGDRGAPRGGRPLGDDRERLSAHPSEADPVPDGGVCRQNGVLRCVRDDHAPGGVAASGAVRGGLYRVFHHAASDRSAVAPALVCFMTTTFALELV